SALAAGFAAPGGRAGRALRATALAALALYAYFRWITPSAVPMALACQALAQATLPLAPQRWRRLALIPSALGWLILANLYRSTGDGPGVFVGDGVKAALLAALVIGAGYGLWRAWRRRPRPRAGLALEAGSLVVMAILSLTLDWDFWPVIAGSLAVLAAFALDLYASRRPEAEPSPSLPRAAWALAFLGQAAMAYAFVR
ncbi:MAG TPA: hypothetical protein VIJ94_15220, partial [Caulobacteraceae bacterium]